MKQPWFSKAVLMLLQADDHEFEPGFIASVLKSTARSSGRVREPMGIILCFWNYYLVCL